MKLRHASLLVLLGWYLMVPVPGHDPIPDPAISFAKWITIRSFDSAEVCESGRLKVIEGGTAGPQLMAYHESEVKKVLLLSQCVASNDPRLK
jgi:hypothetical protein